MTTPDGINTSATADAAIRNRVHVPLDIGGSEPVQAEFIAFHHLVDGREHLALRFGEPDPDGCLVRLHSECLTGDVFGSLRCDCGPQLREAVTAMSRHGGYLLYLRQEGRGIGLYNKLDAYVLQTQGRDTYQANRELGRGADERDYTAASQMLRALGVRSVDLLTNNPDKVAQLTAHGVTVRSVRRTSVHLSPENHDYLSAKVEQTRHDIDLEGLEGAAL